MKHIVNITKILGVFIVNLIATVIGFIILPIAVLFRENTINKESESNQEKFAWNWVDKIWGNEYDGFGDKYYRRDYPVDTYWSRLNWCMLRNPTHNLAIRMGVNNKVIVKSVISGNPHVTDDPCDKNMGLKFQECWDDEGNYYPMYYYCQMWRNIVPFYKGDRGFRLLMGYKNFCVQELDEVYKYGCVCVMTPFKMFVKG